jgi:hypothetical protein
MSFMRAKEIPPGSGNWYDYEVMTTHEGSHVRQKVIKYLGRSGSHSYLSGSTHEILTSKSLLSVSDNPMLDDSRITKIKTPARQIASAKVMYYGGMSLDAIQQQFKQDYNLDMKIG